MTDDAVERGARALHDEAHDFDTRCQWDGLSDRAKTRYKEMTKAVLNAVGYDELVNELAVLRMTPALLDHQDPNAQVSLETVQAVDAMAAALAALDGEPDGKS